MAKTDAFPALVAKLDYSFCDICCISETWLNKNVPTHLVCPNSLCALRKDILDRLGGEVAIMCRGDRKLERLEGIFSNNFECLWLNVTTPNSAYYVCVIYHPPDPVYSEEDLLEFLITSCEHATAIVPNSKIIVGGDVNQLKYKDLLIHASLSQMVKQPTRNNNILYVFITNTPYLWDKIKITKSLIRTDHQMVLAIPRTPAKARRVPRSLEMLENNKINMAILLKDQD